MKIGIREIGNHLGKPSSTPERSAPAEPQTTGQPRSRAIYVANIVPNDRSAATDRLLKISSSEVAPTSDREMHYQVLPSGEKPHQGSHHPFPSRRNWRDQVMRSGRCCPIKVAQSHTPPRLFVQPASTNARSHASAPEPRTSPGAPTPMIQIVIAQAIWTSTPVKSVGEDRPLHVCGADRCVCHQHWKDLHIQSGPNYCQRLHQ